MMREGDTDEQREGIFRFSSLNQSQQRCASSPFSQGARSSEPNHKCVVINCPAKGKILRGYLKLFYHHKLKRPQVGEE